MKRVINCETGEETLVPFTEEELAQQAIDQAEAEKAQAEAEAKAEARAQAQAKLAALGLTTDDLRALGL